MFPSGLKFQFSGSTLSKTTDPPSGVSTLKTFSPPLLINLSNFFKTLGMSVFRN